MKKAIIAKKIGMTQVFTENGALTRFPRTFARVSKRWHEKTKEDRR